MPLRSFLRTPSEHGHHRVTYVELLFDLVFVFAITQLSHLLIDHFSLAAAGASLVAAARRLVGMDFHGMGDELDRSGAACPCEHCCWC